MGSLRNGWKRDARLCLTSDVRATMVPEAGGLAGEAKLLRVRVHDGGRDVGEVVREERAGRRARGAVLGRVLGRVEARLHAELVYRSHEVAPSRCIAPEFSMQSVSLGDE